MSKTHRMKERRQYDAAEDAFTSEGGGSLLPAAPSAPLGRERLTAEPIVGRDGHDGQRADAGR